VLAYLIEKNRVLRRQLGGRRLRLTDDDRRKASRRVEILGSTPHPDGTFMSQIVRNFALADAAGGRVLICDRDAKWRRAVRARFQDAGIRVVRTPYRAPNANAYAERFVRSIKEECPNRLIPLGERHHRRVVAESVAHQATVSSVQCG